MPSIVFYDTTLRDGAQGEGVMFSPDDKIRIAEKLDTLGIDYIEGLARLKPQGYRVFQKNKRLPVQARQNHRLGSTGGPTTPERSYLAKSAGDPDRELLRSLASHGLSMSGSPADYSGENLQIIEDSLAF